MNLGASPEPSSSVSGGELYPTFSSAEVERVGGLKSGFLNRLIKNFSKIFKRFDLQSLPGKLNCFRCG